MSDVAEIISNIKSQSLLGQTSVLDDEKVLRYLNRAYQKVYSHIARNYPSLFTQTQTVAIAGGVGTFSPAVYTVISVHDSGNGFLPLYRRTIADVEEEYPRLDNVGTPNSYDLTINGLWLYPANSTTVRVRYTPNANVLDANTVEEDIQIPPMHHDALEWETLRIIAYDERDKLSAAELAETKLNAADATARLVEYLDSQLPEAESRTRRFVG